MVDLGEIIDGYDRVHATILHAPASSPLERPSGRGPSFPRDRFILHFSVFIIIEYGSFFTGVSYAKRSRDAWVRGIPHGR